MKADVMEAISPPLHMPSSSSLLALNPTNESGCPESQAVSLLLTAPDFRPLLCCHHSTVRTAAGISSRMLKNGRRTWPRLRAGWEDCGILDTVSSELPAWAVFAVSLEFLFKHWRQIRADPATLSWWALWDWEYPSICEPDGLSLCSMAGHRENGAKRAHVDQGAEHLIHWLHPSQETVRRRKAKRAGSNTAAFISGKTPAKHLDANCCS